MKKWTCPFLKTTYLESTQGRGPGGEETLLGSLFRCSAIRRAPRARGLMHLAVRGKAVREHRAFRVRPGAYSSRDPVCIWPSNFDFPRCQGTLDHRTKPVGILASWLLRFFFLFFLLGEFSWLDVGDFSSVKRRISGDLGNREWCHGSTSAFYLEGGN